MNKLLLLLPLVFIGCAETNNTGVDTTQLEIAINDLEHQIVLSQNEINELQQLLSELATNENIVQFIDPCGDKPNVYDEIVMRTSKNKLIAFFKNGSRRELIVLEPGDYVTTDAQHCRFTVLKDVEIVSAFHE